MKSKKLKVTFIKFAINTSEIMKPEKGPWNDTQKQITSRSVAQKYLKKKCIL